MHGTMTVKWRCLFMELFFSITWNLPYSAIVTRAECELWRIVTLLVLRLFGNFNIYTISRWQLKSIIAVYFQRLEP